MKHMIDAYKKLTLIKYGPLFDESNFPVKTYIPIPTDSDYQRSYIERYFIRKLNDSNGIIYEVDDRRFSKYKNNLLYTTVSIYWKISKAPINEVIETNRKSILYGQKNIENLNLYLPNLTQFYKNIDY